MKKSIFTIYQNKKARLRTKKENKNLTERKNQQKKIHKIDVKTNKK